MFELKKKHYHVYLGFCREDENIGFTALTFGLLTALILFTKFAMPLLRF